MTLQTANEKLVIPLAEIQERTPSPQSMMPEGILTPPSLDEIGALVTYLGAREQVPLKLLPAATLFITRSIKKGDKNCSQGRKTLDCMSCGKLEGLATLATASAKPAV